MRGETFGSQERMLLASGQERRRKGINDNELGN